MNGLIQVMGFVWFLPIGVGWIWGIHCLFSEGYLFEGVGKWLNDKFPYWICDPLFACPTCQSSVHGSLIFFLFVKMPLMWWPLYCITLCGINFLINKVIDDKMD